MMSTNVNTLSHRDVLRQLSRRVTIVILVSFLVLALISAFVTREVRRADLEAAQVQTLDSVSQQMADWWEQATADAQFLASSELTRQFAGSLDESTEAADGLLQQAMMQTFATTLERQSNTYLAIRYVTVNGYVRSEVSIGGDQIVVNEESRPLSPFDQQAFEQSIVLTANQVGLSDLMFQRDPVTGTVLEPVTPFVRFVVPVDPITVNQFGLGGQVQLDVSTKPLADLFSAALLDNPRRRLVLVDNLGYVLVDSANSDPSSPDQNTETILNLSASIPEMASVLTNDDWQLNADVFDRLLVSSRQLQVGSLQGRAWQLLVVDDIGTGFDSAVVAALGALIGVSAIGIIAAVAARFVLLRGLQPLAATAAMALQITEADGSAPAPSTNTGLPEIVTAFEHLERRVKDLNSALEGRSSRYRHNLEIATRISRETSSLYNIDAILNRAIELICTEYGFYHAQVFLVDDVSQFAVLRYSRGDAGAQLLARGHKLGVGSLSVIGQVTARGDAVIVNDTTVSSGEPHRYNPLLPDTRAEMALPMLVGGRIIGALDIQSVEINAFREDELQIFQLLADQLAVAVENSRLIIESERRVEQIDQLNQQFTRRAWQEDLSQREVESGYSYDLMDVKPAAEASAGALSVPITVRGVVVGDLAAGQPGDDSFTDGDQAFLRAIADRIGLAIENARLLGEIQSNLSETFILYQISRLLSEASSLEEVIRVVIDVAVPDAHAGLIAVFDETDTEAIGTLIFQAAWHKSHHLNLGGTALSQSNHPLLSAMEPDQVTLVQNAALDQRVDSTLQALLLEPLESQALILIPFSVRGEWRGILFVGFAQAREFSEREGRVYQTLIDQTGVTIENRLLLIQNEAALAQIERLYGGSRVVNMAQNAQDVVRAAVVANTDLSIGFELALLEGELDATGYPTQMHFVARTIGVEVVPADETWDLTVSGDSLLRHREPLDISAASTQSGAEDFARLMRRRRYQVGIVFPLYSSNYPTALFFIVSEDEVQLSAEDIEVYRALAGQMSTVLQNRRLLEQTRQALDESRRLYEASRAIAAAESAVDVYGAATHHLAEALPVVTRVSILTLESDAAYLKYDYGWSRSGEVVTHQRLLAQNLPFQRLLETYGSPLRYNHLSENLQVLRLDALDEWFRSRGSQSAVILSLQTRNRILGTVIIESDHLDAFTPQYLPFAQAVADQLATAVESLNSFILAQVQARRALALAEAGQLANRIGADLGGSLHAVFTRVAEAADYRFWQLLVIDESHEILEEVAAEMPESTQTRANHYQVETSTHSIVEAYRSGVPVVINDPLGARFFAQYAPEVRAEFGKHMAVPVALLGDKMGVLLLGRSLEDADFTDRDEQLGLTLASQVAVALENRRLLRTTETERETLRSILETLPVSVMVLDARSLRILQANQQSEVLFGLTLDSDVIFDIEIFNLYRTGTNVFYPKQEMPIYLTQQRQIQESSDDVTIIRPDGVEIDVLVNAAPLFDENSRMTSIIVAFQDISTLRSLENTLQENLRETITLYETTRALAEASEISDVLDQAVLHLSTQNVSDVWVLLDKDGAWEVVRTLSETRVEVPANLLKGMEAIFISDVTEAQPTLSEMEIEYLTSLGYAGIASLPLRTRTRTDRPLGWIVILFETTQEMTIEREQGLTTLIESAAVTLDNRYLFQQTEQSLAEMASLYSATSAISRAQDLRELTQALQRAFENLQPEFIAVYLEQNGTLQQVMNLGLGSQSFDLRPVLNQALSTLRSPLYLENVAESAATNPVAKTFLTETPLRAAALVPLRLQNRSSGCFILGYQHPRQFATSETRFLTSVADSASVVNDNITLLEQIQSNLTETSMLYLASRALNDAATEQDLLNVVTEHLLERPTSRVLVLLLNGRSWNEPGAMLSVVASWQPEYSERVDLSEVVLTPDEFPAWSLLTENDVVVVDDVETDPRLDSLARFAFTNMDLRSLSVMPLRSSSRSMGIIIIGSDAPVQHTERDLRVLRAFSRQASLRLEASRLFEQTERRARQLATSARVAQLASSLEELSRLLPTIVDLIKDAFKYDHVQIFLMDDENEYAVLRASTGAAGQKLLAIQHKLKRGSASVIGRVTASAEPVVALDTADSRVVHRPNPYLPNTRSEMAVPLILKGQVIGALDVQSNQANFFADDDVAVLTTLASQISVAIDNASMYEQSQARAKDMYFLFTVATAASGAENLRDAMRNVVISLQELLDASAVSIYLPVVLTDGESTRTELRPAALAGPKMPVSELSEVSMEDTDNLIANVAETQQPRVIADVSAEPNYIPIVTQARSAIIVPLTLGSQLISVISVESAQVAAYDDETMTLLLTLSSTLAATVQNQQLLEELQRTNEQLLELDRLKSDFLANMSHELRTPLNSIIGFSRVILKGIDGPLTEMQEQDLSTIYNSGQHLLNLINDILDQAKIAAGKMDLQIDYFDMKPVIDGVRSIGIGLVKDKPIEIAVHVAPGMPKAYGDEFRTRQVLLNLVSNASKFTKEGAITINAYPVNDQVSGLAMLCVEVTDTGMGIADKDLPLLFEPFRQVDSSLTKTHGGTGLGLPIAKSLMEMQNGRIDVRSQVNLGSTFSLYIPTQPVETAPADEEEPETNSEPSKVKTGETGVLDSTKLSSEVLAKLESLSAEPANGSNGHSNGAGNGKAPEPKPVVDQNAETARHVIMPPPRKLAQLKRQILIIEDNIDMVDQFRRTLQREGFDVFAASIPLEAEAMASGLRPTLIVLDVNFANNSGWAILERLQQREDTVDIPVIVVALGDESGRAHALGAFRFIRKPFMPEMLAEAAHQAEQEAQIERILIIDDDPDSARLLQDLLTEHTGYRVYWATNGVEGISMVARRRPNLIILDLRMPEMDGFSVVEELRANPETTDIPIMVVTGETLNQTEIVRLSALKVIYKPDLDMEGQRAFLDNVKLHLSRQNGN